MQKIITKIFSKKWWLVTVCVIALLGTLAGCGGNTENNQSESTPTPTSKSTDLPSEESTATPTEESTPEPEEESALAVGDTTTLGDWEITLDSFEVTDSVENTFGSFNADDGNQYVVVTLTVKNTGTTSDTFFSSFAFGNTDIRSKIVYQGKYEYSSSNLLGHSDDLHDKSLNPLTTLTGFLAYQVVDEAANSDELVLNITLGKNTITYALK